MPQISKNFFLPLLLFIVGITAFAFVMGCLFYYSHLGFAGWHDYRLPDISHDEKSIVTSSIDNNIISINLDDGLAQELTSSQEYDAWPSFSFDDKKIVFSRGNEHGANLFEISTDNKILKQITFDKRVLDYHAKYSSSGRQIAFIRKRLGNFNDLMIHDLDTGTSHIAKKNIGPFPKGLYWSNDNGIYYILPENDHDVLHCFNLSDKKSSQQIRQNICYVNLAQDIELGLLRERGESFYLYRLAKRKFLSNDKWQFLTTPCYDPSCPVISGRGNILVFVLDSEKVKHYRSIYVMDVVAKTIKELMPVRTQRPLNASKPEVPPASFVEYDCTCGS